MRTPVDMAGAYLLVKWVNSNFIRENVFAAASWERFETAFFEQFLDCFRWKDADFVGGDGDCSQWEELSDDELNAKVVALEDDGLVRYKICPALGGADAGTYPPPRTPRWPKFYKCPRGGMHLTRTQVLKAFHVLYVEHQWEDQIHIAALFKKEEAAEWCELRGQTSYRVEPTKIV